ncbi:MAG: ankyrin repeat domain-containing protein [Sphingobacteriales bacterium]|nr:MAG: ankyrin repeat domain-containing protein [Sphingobacteriales bacterium]
MHNLYVLETNKKNELLHLLDLTDFKTKTSLANQQSTLEDWTKEANKLAKQGKDEQAEAIKTQFLKKQPLPYTPLNEEALLELVPQALNKDFYNKKAKDKLFNSAILNFNVTHLNQLSVLKYNAANNWATEGKNYLRRTYIDYATDNLKTLIPKLEKYGINYRSEVNHSPLMLACFFGAEKICKYLVDNGADTAAVDMFGKNALQVTLVNALINPDKKNDLIKNAFKYYKNQPIRLQFEDKLIKIDAHQGEYWMVQFVLATSQMRISSLAVGLDNGALYSDTFASFFEGIADNIIPDFRKKRSYISSLLAKNEINRDDKYNKKLFLRLKNGIYVLNPFVKIYSNDQWLGQKHFYGLNTFSQYLDPQDQRFTGIFK